MSAGECLYIGCLCVCVSAYTGEEKEREGKKLSGISAHTQRARNRSAKTQYKSAFESAVNLALLCDQPFDTQRDGAQHTDGVFVERSNQPLFHTAIETRSKIYNNPPFKVKHSFVQMPRVPRVYIHILCFLMFCRRGAPIEISPYVEHVLAKICCKIVINNVRTSACFDD